MQNQTRRRAASFVVCSMAFVSLAFAEDVKPIHIPPGQLAAALETLARQSGTEIVYVSAQVAAIRTSGVGPASALPGSRSARETAQRHLV